MRLFSIKLIHLIPEKLLCIYILSAFLVMLVSNDMFTYKPFNYKYITLIGWKSVSPAFVQTLELQPVSTSTFPVPIMIHIKMILCLSIHAFEML